MVQLFMNSHKVDRLEFIQQAQRVLELIQNISDVEAELNLGLSATRQQVTAISFHSVEIGARPVYRFA